eukprot:m.337208 g.337208  ORF g.337208 m.337208 type:complete len:77 (+) comp18075_c0_seq1:360-590(+)
MMSKVEVNGKQTHPLWSYMKKHAKGTLGSRIKWNFCKIMVDHEGIPKKRFFMENAGKMEAEIKNALDAAVKAQAKN